MIMSPEVETVPAEHENFFEIRMLPGEDINVRRGNIFQAFCAVGVTLELMEARKRRLPEEAARIIKEETERSVGYLLTIGMPESIARGFVESVADKVPGVVVRFNFRRMTPEESAARGRRYIGDLGYDFELIKPEVGIDRNE